MQTLSATITSSSVKFNTYDQFVKLSSKLLSRSDLSLSSKVVLAVVMDHLWNNDTCWPGIRRLCSLTALTDKTIDRAIRELETAGLLAVDRPGIGKRNVYSLPEPRGEKRRRNSDTFTPKSAGETPTVKKTKAPESCPKAPEFCPPSAGETPA